VSKADEWPNKAQLLQLADELLLGEANALPHALAFFYQESRGHWHNRARAMLARRFKHVVLDGRQREQLCACILGRLSAGNFTEQFIDQLKLAWRLDPLLTRSAAQAALGSTRAHVRRYAQRALSFTAPPL